MSLARPDPILPLPPLSVIVPPSVPSPALETHLFYHASGPIRQIPHAIENNASLGVARKCSYGLERPDCALPPLDDCSPSGSIYTITANLISANSGLSRCHLTSPPSAHSLAIRVAKGRLARRLPPNYHWPLGASVVFA